MTLYQLYLNILNGTPNLTYFMSTQRGAISTNNSRKIENQNMYAFLKTNNLKQFSSKSTIIDQKK